MKKTKAPDCVMKIPLLSDEQAKRLIRALKEEQALEGKQL